MCKLPNSFIYNSTYWTDNVLAMGDAILFEVGSIRASLVLLFLLAATAKWMPKWAMDQLLPVPELALLK